LNIFVLCSFFARFRVKWFAGFVGKDGEQLPHGASVLDSVGMFAISPFEETLYLDSDTVVLVRLDSGSAMARRCRLACGA
jgi:hypothetical protein